MGGRWFDRPDRGLEYHEPVLLKETLELLVTDPDGVYVDATMGGGGHSRAILERLGPGGRLISVDRDRDAHDNAEKWAAAYGERLHLVRGNFAGLAEILAGLGIAGVDGILVDLGVSSRQLDDGERGFSFIRPGPLDMRMDRASGKSAAELVAVLPESELVRIFREYGEEPQAKRAARAITAERAKRPLDTTESLADLIEKTLGRRSGKHPATKIFQALRIAVNGELEALEKFLESVPALLKPGGRVAVISYHSLEDRMVKTFFRRCEPKCVCPPLKPICDCGRPGQMESVIRKAVKPSDVETAANPRARSARLRIARKLGAGA